MRHHFEAIALSRPPFIRDDRRGDPWIARKIASFSPSLSEHLCYNDSYPKQLRTPMPNTGNFSDHEKPQAMNLLDIHDDINPVPSLRAYPSPLAQNATLSEKGFPLSDKRTMSHKTLTNQKLYDNLALTPDPSIQRHPARRRAQSARPPFTRDDCRGDTCVARLRNTPLPPNGKKAPPSFWDARHRDGGIRVWGGGIREQIVAHCRQNYATLAT